VVVAITVTTGSRNNGRREGTRMKRVTRDRITKCKISAKIE